MLVDVDDGLAWTSSTGAEVKSMTSLYHVSVNCKMVGACKMVGVWEMVGGWSGGITYSSGARWARWTCRDETPSVRWSSMLPGCQGAGWRGL